MTLAPRATSRRPHGVTLIEILITAVLLVLGAMMGVMHAIRSSQHLDFSRDQAFARERAVSILSELRAFVEGGEGESASDLDGFDDGASTSPVLSIAPDPLVPGALVEPDHPISGNVEDNGRWRFHRRISVRPYGTVHTRDLRFVTVRVFRQWPGQDAPGDTLAEVSSIIRTIGGSFPTTQVYDVYLLALENVPGWWVNMDAIQPFVESALVDLEGRNRGLRFRTHWITRLGYGRDEEYAPYTNEERASTDATPWAYVYPGRLPAGEAAARYYVAGRMRARVNVDGETTPQFRGEVEPGEPFTDLDGDGRWDVGEPYDDLDGDGAWSPGNPLPYALADMHNHCMRWPEAQERFLARERLGLEDPATPTWRLLLDRMTTHPEEFHNALLVNLHGELLPMPPARNVSDPARDPERLPGWRVVTHPERLLSRRVQGEDALSDTPRFRVHAWRNAFDDDAVITTQEEPFHDADGNGTWSAGETFEDWNGNGTWDAGTPVSIVVRDADLTAAVNAATSPSLVVRCLSGGVDADGDGQPDPYVDWRPAARYPEAFADGNGDGIRQVAEAFLDLDGDGLRGALEPWQERDGDGQFSVADEALVDGNGNGAFDAAAPAEPFTDTNANGRWDAAEPYWDADGDGVRDPASSPQTPWMPWDPIAFGNATLTADYIAAYGEPFLDVDGDGAYDAAEPFTDRDGNGVRDGGFTRGEMWFEVEHRTAPQATVLHLHGTPLEAPYDASTQRGLPAAARLYDLDYVPCPTPATANGSDRFENDLYAADAQAPKNTARWLLEIPLAAVRTGWETSAGAADGDACDRILTLETRFGADLATGTRWPSRHDPQNLSVTHTWFYGDAADVPPSERYQFLGDPRHCPYADLDATGTTSPHGYNWYFDDFQDGTYDARGDWKAFDAARLRDGWLGRGSGHDVARLLAWLRNALVDAEAVYTTLTGFSYYYLSVGGDVGSDAANGFPDSIPVDGAPFGLTGDVYENTITDGGGTSALQGSRKLVRTRSGTDTGLRAGGRWWSKPWLGELWPDEAYATQWKPWGNLRASASTTTDTFELVRRGEAPAAQQPRGTQLVDLYARLAREGCTAVFHIGTASQTFHHESASGTTGDLVDQGLELATSYDFDVPDTVAISRPFRLTSSSGGVGDEFSFTDSYPRFDATLLAELYDHENGPVGSGVVGLAGPASDSGRAYVVVNGIDRTLETGSAFIGRYAVLSLLHAFLHAGDPLASPRIRQVPRVQVDHPTLITELQDPVAIELRWSTTWTRWDGRPYTSAYPADHAEDESDLLYVLLLSRDNGGTWENLLTGAAAVPGVLPRRADGLVDPSGVLPDYTLGGDETWTWSTPAGDVPAGSYLIRVEAYRGSEALHNAHHVERIYVER